MSPSRDVPPATQVPSETAASPVIGRYRLLAEVGRGGMADVFLAAIGGDAATGFHKLLIVKLLKAELADEPEFVQMFMDEARLAARLNHPNVVQTLEVGRDGGRFYLAMEYLDGQPLHRILQRSSDRLRLSLSMRLTILVRALAGLHYAHQLTDYGGSPLNIVHRDISPANLFVTYDGFVKLVDFGIAKAVDSNAGTRVGMFKGKVAYIPPEQARGEPVDRCADLYSAGVVLWEMITGRRMWRGLTQAETLRRVASGEVPTPTSVEPRVPLELEAICMKALSFRKEDRHQTAEALAAQIEEFARRRCPLTAEADLGKAIADGFSAERKKIREIIEAQLMKPAHASDRLPSFGGLSEPSNSSMQSLPSLTPTPSSVRRACPLAPPPRPAEPAVDRPGGQATPVSRSPPAFSWHRLALLGGGAALAAILVLVGVLLLGRSRENGNAPVAAAAAQEPAASPLAVRGVTPTEILVGMSGAFSGPAREIGQSMKLGLEIAFQAANDAGGIHGRKLKLIALDDGYEASRALETTRELLDQRGAFAIVGNVGTPTSVVAARYAAQRQTVFFGALSGSPVLRQDPPGRYVFNYRASYQEETAKSVGYLVDLRKIEPEQMVVFAQEDSYGDAAYDGVVKALRKRGRNEEILRVGYKRNTADVDQAVASLLHYDGGDARQPALHPVKAVMMAATYRAAAKLIQKILQRGRLSDALFVNVSFVGSDELAEELRNINTAFCPNVIVTQVVPPFDSGATGVLNYRAQLSRYQPQAQPGFVSLEGFIVGELFVEALKRVGPEPSSERLVNTLEQIRDLDLGIGTKVGFSTSEHQGSHKVWGTRLDKSCTYKVFDLE